MTLPDPVKISPLIKLFRYVFLISGIIYGAKRQKYLEIKEEGLKGEKEKRAIEKAKFLERQKRLAQERDLQQIIEAFGGDLKQTNEKMSNQLDNNNNCEEGTNEEMLDINSGNVKRPDEGV